MNKEGKDMVDEKEWDRYLRSVEVARSLVREETALWRDNTGLSDEDYTATAMAMELYLFAMSLRVPMTAGGLDTVEFFCELMGVDYWHIAEAMDNALTYGRAAVAAEDSGA